MQSPAKIDLLRRDTLFYVVGNNPLEGQLAFGRGIGARTIRFDSLGAHMAGDPSLVFDLDLRRAEVMRVLKPGLSRRGLGCRIFLVDPNSRATAVQARTLGADAILPTSAGPRDIQTALHAHFGIGQSTGGAEAAVLHSVDSGVDAIGNSFHAFEAGLAFSMSTVDTAGGQIADAIKGVGVEEWLATVRGYHVGTYQHCMLVTGVASAFASGTGMARRDVIKLTTAGMLHDIGKAAIPLDLLDKPAALSDEEQQIVRTHPAVGYEYLTRRSSVDADIQSSVRSHHEYLDGTGYPDGLGGSEIGDLTRILTICDIYAALIERRSYKPPKTPAQAMIILNAMASARKLETSLVRAFGNVVAQRKAAA